ncbi:nicotianamine synthase [Saccharopolyspora sp. HNM0983]|uniref:Nicotianamine synthase n=1 Tax=Saccharopolyspora montiporae TaxID=2781240 RepID=A0A929G0K9_9PSEU|nr:nicotianamine synthase family protein [Saccharopolyspora sp. HNM0983]MBE9373718.1 nicotianamine synthase [Saccharopolyspora sp. HNM0983]
MDHFESPATTAPPLSSPEAARLLDELHALNEQLLGADLRPSAETNAVFGRLVELCISAEQEVAGDVLAHPDAPALLDSLRRLSAEGETLLEEHWAGALAEADDAWTVLNHFPYLGNYRDLVRLERAAAAAGGVDDLGTVAFLGAGPLPLTGLVLAHEHGVRVVNVDRDENACALAAAATEALGLSDRVSTVQADAAEAARREDVAGADVVALAALVGADHAEKRPVLDALAARLHRRTRLLLRTAHRMRTALYPAISADELHGFRPLLELHPHNEVVNSVLVAQPG